MSDPRSQGGPAPRRSLRRAVTPLLVVALAVADVGSARAEMLDVRDFDHASVHVSPTGHVWIATRADSSPSPSAAAVSFTLLPLFWQAWGITVLLGVLVVGGGIALFHLRNRRVAAERQRLEGLVEVRTRELREKTNRLEAEAAERERLQSQLNQAQKMEAVGRLAGGIAHDFNNLLTVVMGHAQLVAADDAVPESLRRDVDAIQSAAERGASLVAQLLAISRRQMVRATRLDLNASVRRSAQLLERLIGDDVELVVEQAPRPAMIDADETQLGQVLVNLAVNASDAMPQGGRLAVAIGHRTVGEALAGPGPDRVPAGSWVTLTITDNGQGMTPETRERAFEPFFTTKEVGRGTGLGMSTVYGMVHQCGGHVHLDSEVGRGTEVRIFLPDATAEEAGERLAPAGAVREA